MRTWNWHFWLCLTGTILLAAGVVFLPRHISRSLDRKDLNWVELNERDDFSFLEPGTDSVLGNERAFRHLTRDGENLTLISSIQDPGRMNSELLEQVYDQVMIASEQGLLPWVGARGYKFGASLAQNGASVGEEEEKIAVEPYGYWADQVQFARYYSLTCESEENPNKTEMINFWYLRFSDNETFDYYFVVNAISYQIYYAEIYNAYTDFYAALAESADNYEVAEAEIEGERIVLDKSDASSYEALFAVGCMDYYQAEGYTWVGSENLYDKLGLVILYYGGQSVYISQSVTQNDTSLAYDSGLLTYRGIGTGFQELANKVRFLTE